MTCCPWSIDIERPSSPRHLARETKTAGHNGWAHGFLCFLLGILFVVVLHKFHLISSYTCVFIVDISVFGLLLSFYFSCLGAAARIGHLTRDCYDGT